MTPKAPTMKQSNTVQNSYNECVSKQNVTQIKHSNIKDAINKNINRYQNSEVSSGGLGNNQHGCSPRDL